MKIGQIFLFACAIYALPDASTFAQTCPPAPTSIDPTITAGVSFDSGAAVYKYDYIVSSGKDSLLPIYYFTFLLSQQPSNVTSSDNWQNRYVNRPQVTPNLRWATISTNSADASQVGGSDLPTPDYAIQPGKRLDGFGFQSSQRPGILQYYAEGFTQVPTTVATDADDEPQPNCPGWDFETPQLQTLVTGMSVGPSSPNEISVRIRLRTSDGQNQCGPLDPNNPAGEIGVLVLSSHHFEASTINVSSLRLGPGGASPVSSRLVAPTVGTDFGHDEKADWEQFDDENSSDVRSPNLLLVFNLSAIELRCVLDKALFLTGTTQSGQEIIGGASTRTVGCDIHKPGTRRH